jgi:sigma-B regulation protein RsbU (phosphoserine phosphatase)
MLNSELSILVVDDAKFSSAIIKKTLTSEGYGDVRVAETGKEALEQMRGRTAHIVVADWMMPEMDGLTLTREIRKLDQANGHFTYVILLSAHDEADAVMRAFDAGVDDFVNKAAIRTELIPRFKAAARIANRYDAIVNNNKALAGDVAELRYTNTQDEVTGLGNEKVTLKNIVDTLRQVERRGGAACLLTLGIKNLPDLKETHDPVVVDEVVRLCSDRLRQLLRPLDTITRTDEGTFNAIMHVPNIEDCSASSFRRVFEGLNLRSFKTSEGYIAVDVGLSITACHGDFGIPEPEPYLDLATEKLAEAYETGLITTTIWGK